MNKLESKLQKRGELVQFNIPFNGNSPVYLEIIGRINNQDNTSGNSEIFNINNEEKSLLLYNVPVFLTKDSIIDLFERFGSIKEITVNKYDSNGNKMGIKPFESGSENSWVYIIFNEIDSIQKIKDDSIINHKDSIRKLYINDSSKFLLGKSDIRFKNILMRITNKRVNSILLQKEVDSYMTNYDIEREIEEENLKLESTIPDEDGFIKVVSKKQKAPDGTVIHSFEPSKTTQGFNTKKQINKKEKKKTYNDFYRFQIRENKKKEIQKLNYS
ncbi:Ribosomal RNA-processing protein 7 (RRP7) family protein [Cryptosporidium meleagridis]|uniref:Ribosomal RNA-processing protein 7 (RRP7) family protein n=1 Tax=Cryptosporidium meleagridis TaxID=93969 RepID=A0A2P4Z0P1_9CRYT|nr:Ribosomal RNA-processing protein 7 (RRP7) family protein [Cryptosporidium meleagridis]